MIDKLLRVSLDLKASFNNNAKKYDLTYQQWQVLKLINTAPSGEISAKKILRLLQ